jgi:hypothetical protein
MIDRDWLQRVLAFAEADPAGLDVGTLAVLLAEQEEVLPYLFVHAREFSAWPMARAALAKAAGSAVRHDPGAIRTGQRPQASSPDRTALYDVLHAVIARGETLSPLGVAEPAKTPGIAAALHLIGTVRLDEHRGDDAPSLFIQRD